MRKRPMNPKTKKKLYIITAVGALLLLLILFLLLFKGCDNSIFSGTPTLAIETPQKISKSDTNDFSLDVTISTLGKANYPAASMSIAFDSSRLCFIGIEEGNVFVADDESNLKQKLPNWRCNPEQSNKTGKINIMYLDITGGKNAFSQRLLAQNDKDNKDNIVLKLKFRLRGSVSEGDVLDLIFDDAVFAASDESKSLAMTTNTLKVRDGKIVIGE